MPAVTLFVFQDIPAHLEMLRCEPVGGYGNALHRDRGAAVSDVSEHFFIAGEAFESHTAVCSLGHCAQGRIGVIRVCSCVRRSKQHTVESADG